MPRTFAIILILAGFLIQFASLALLVSGRVEDPVRIAPAVAVGGLALLTGFVLAFLKPRT